MTDILLCARHDLFSLLRVNLHLFGAKLGFGGSIDAASLLEFVDSGHDLIMAADASASELIREIAVECGVDFDEVKFCFVWFPSICLHFCYYIEFFF